MQRRVLPAMVLVRREELRSRENVFIPDPPRSLCTAHFMHSARHAPKLGFKSNFSSKIRCFSPIFQPFVRG